MPTPTLQPPPPRWHLWTLVILLLPAAVIRVHDIHTYDFWLDEFWTVELSTGRGSVHLDLPHDTILDPPPKTTQLADAPPWYTVWTGMERVTHPPLYFLLLRIWRETFGGSDVAARMLSVTASLAALALLWDIARRMFGPAAALAASALFLVAWPQVEYAQQARNYAVLTALALGMLWPIVRMRQDAERADAGWTWPRGAILFAATLATLLTHYFAAGTVLAMFLAVFLCLRGCARTLSAAAMLLASVAFLVVWGPWMWEQRHVFRTSDPTTVFLVDDAPGHVWRTITRLAMQPGLLVAPFQKPWHWFTLAGLVVWFWPIFSRRRDQLLPAWLWMTGTIAVIALLDLTRGTKHLDYPRYTLLAGPGVYLLIAAVCAPPKTAAAKWRWTGHALAATLVVVAFMVTRHTERKWRSFRHLAATIDDAAHAGDVVVFACPGQQDEWVVGALYLGYNHYSDEPHHPVLLLRRGLTDEARDRLRRATRVWLVIEYGGQPESILPGFKAIDGGFMNGYPAAIWLMR